MIQKWACSQSGPSGGSSPFHLHPDHPCQLHEFCRAVEEEQYLWHAFLVGAGWDTMGGTSFEGGNFSV